MQNYLIGYAYFQIGKNWPYLGNMILSFDEFPREIDLIKFINGLVDVSEMERDIDIVSVTPISFDDAQRFKERDEDL